MQDLGTSLAISRKQSFIPSTVRIWNNLSLPIRNLSQN